ncbi:MULTISPECIES: GNAT family N-acetyltransferase [Acinetobacter]|jgi:predicted GNAT family N-acyltransferase|uniref:GNAT family N-acetyltransferase n=1 Tax=Acinetobacter TaxID=469 RepID=UPI000DF83E62|nr:GNAT family N-acetyltransferase [Acinetobacter sp. YH16052]RDC53468.1 GNAT family N-acetyltransferase [Acinetobacter sp. RIT592]
MLNSPELKIVSGSWKDLAAHAKAIREAVFIQEQHIAAEDEWDAEDAVAVHFIVFQQDQAIATARLLSNHSIGRVAVLTTARGLGVGQRLMQAVIDYARAEQRGLVKLSSQVHAIGFYQALGFEVQGEEYLDCGIPHIDMYLKL